MRFKHVIYLNTCSTSNFTDIKKKRSSDVNKENTQSLLKQNNLALAD